MSFPDRSWMYRRLLNDGSLNNEFVHGIENFISSAIKHPELMNGPDEVRCPCKQCGNRAFRKLDDVMLHLCQKGFLSDYYVWDRHGEPYNFVNVENPAQSSNHNSEPLSPMRNTVFDAVGPEFPDQVMEEEPNAEAKKFFDMLEACDEELWPGCEKLSVLSVVARLLNINSEYHLSKGCFDRFIEFFQHGS
ncbi:hypothetical protein M5689_010846 [Euphorbia peplus]|nr:hypothetical protein M5689_010846 [Euphorbia peplus]